MRNAIIVNIAAIIMAKKAPGAVPTIIGMKPIIMITAPLAVLSPLSHVATINNITPKNANAKPKRNSFSRKLCLASCSLVSISFTISTGKF